MRTHEILRNVDASLHLHAFTNFLISRMSVVVCGSELRVKIEIRRTYIRNSYLLFLDFFQKTLQRAEVDEVADLFFSAV